MTLRLGRPALVAALIGAATLASGCANFRSYEGYMLDETMVSGIQAGVDNRESVTNTLGRPTFTGQFNDRDWYYVSRESRQGPFTMPRPTSTTVLHVRFDEAGNVASVQRTGMELVRNISPLDQETPTLGRERSFLQELFGNIGSVGGRQQGGETADNPR